MSQYVVEVCGATNKYREGYVIVFINGVPKLEIPLTHKGEDLSISPQADMIFRNGGYHRDEIKMIKAAILRKLAER